MGAWIFVHGRLHRLLRDGYTLTPREPGRVGQPGHAGARPCTSSSTRTCCAGPSPDRRPLGRRRPAPWPVDAGGSAQRDPDDAFELGEGVARVGDLDGDHAQLARAGFRLTPRSSRKTAGAGSIPSARRP